MTPPPSPSRSSSEHRSTSKFHLPAQAKAVLFLSFAGALVSITRVERVFQDYPMSAERLLRTATSTTLKLVSSSPVTNSFPRVVLLADNETWALNTTKTESAERPKRTLDAAYTLELRNWKMGNETEDDVTRFYPVGSSKDDFPSMERRRWPRHEWDPHCEPSAAWQSEFHPVCNEIHAVADLGQALVTEELSLLSSKGFWRHAWRHSKKNRTETTVWKTFKIAHNFEEKYYEDNRVDAVAMERLTGSPYVIGVYGFCGLTVVQEFAGRELAHVIDANKLNSTARLELARKITRGVADIHSIPADDGRIDQSTLVHNDINLANLVFTADDRPVLNDFNIAILIMKHNETGKACPFHSHFPNPQWKAPEEQVDDDEESHSKPPIVNEKIDIYALGNVLYRMIVGGSPWKRPEAKKLYPDEKIVVARLKRYNGTLPSVPEHILSNATEANDPALLYLLEAMRLCYRFDPATRPTAHELVGFLDDSLKKARKFDAEQSRAMEEAAASAAENSTAVEPSKLSWMFSNNTDDSTVAPIAFFDESK